jgi:hypothetical protein
MVTIRSSLHALARTSLLCVSLTACLGNVDERSDTTGNAAALGAGESNLVREGSNKCLDVKGGGTSNGTKLQQWKCNEGPNQRFVLQGQGNDEFLLMNPNSGKCAAVSGNTAANGTAIVLATCDAGSKAQRFRKEASSGQFFHFVSARSTSDAKACLDVNGASSDNGAKVQVWRCNSTAAQNWKVVSGSDQGGDGDAGDGDGGDGDQSLVWKKANLTNFESYPDPGSEECREFNGCTWAGQFAFVDGKQPESWVKSHNIAAVHSKDASKYKLKTLRLRQGTKQIDVKVYDMCSDQDCNGCCTQNANRGGRNVLIDVEKYTMQRFGTGDGVVEWACIDC